MSRPGTDPQEDPDSHAVTPGQGKADEHDSAPAPAPHRFVHVDPDFARPQNAFGFDRPVAGWRWTLPADVRPEVAVKRLRAAVLQHCSVQALRQHLRRVRNEDEELQDLSIEDLFERLAGEVGNDLSGWKRKYRGQRPMTFEDLGMIAALARDALPLPEAAWDEAVRASEEAKVELAAAAEQAGLRTQAKVVPPDGRGTRQHEEGSSTGTAGTHEVESAAPLAGVTLRETQDVVNALRGGAVVMLGEVLGEQDSRALARAQQVLMQGVAEDAVQALRKRIGLPPAKVAVFVDALSGPPTATGWLAGGRPGTPPQLDPASLTVYLVPSWLSDVHRAGHALLDGWLVIGVDERDDRGRPTRVVVVGAAADHLGEPAEHVASPAGGWVFWGTPALVSWRSGVAQVDAPEPDIL